MKLQLRIKRHASSGLCKVWLIESIGGGANSGFLHGITSEAKAIELATALNLPYTVDDAGIDYATGELEQRERQDYSGGPDGREWIDCPKCGNEVTIRSW